jgi:predicted porin
MKKSLVALAALAATSVFAQSSVTLDGYIDRGYLTTNNTDNTKDSKVLSSAAGTTTIGIKGVEDLGGGMKAGFWISTDWSDLAGASQDGTAATASSIQSGGFANSQNFIELVSASTGTLRLGNINNEILTATTGVAAPAFSTGVGSVYSSAFSVHDGYGTGKVGSVGFLEKGTLGATNGGVRGIRQVNTVKYISPKFSGFTFAYGMAPKNENAGTGTDTVGATDMSIRYANGPLDVMYASLKYKVGRTAPANGSLTANSDNTHTMLAASYAVMPTLKLHAGFGSSKASDTALANAKSTQYGVTYNMGAFDIMANMAKVDNKNATAYDRKMTGFGVNYNLSKTSRVYFRMDDIKLNDGGTVTSGDSIKRNVIGVSRAF